MMVVVVVVVGALSSLIPSPFNTQTSHSKIKIIIISGFLSSYNDHRKAKLRRYERSLDKHFPPIGAWKCTTLNPLGNYNRPTDQTTDQQTFQQTDLMRKLHFQ